jgi:hypothetical protein
LTGHSVLNQAPPCNILSSLSVLFFLAPITFKCNIFYFMSFLIET